MCLFAFRVQRVVFSLMFCAQVERLSAQLQETKTSGMTRDYHSAQLQTQVPAAACHVQQHVMCSSMSCAARHIAHMFLALMSSCTQVTAMAAALKRAEEDKQV
jgi:hypothetical protein